MRAMCAGSRRRTLIIAALAPAMATMLAMLPLLLIDTSKRPPLGLIALLFLLGPIVALVVNWRCPGASNADAALLLALPQIAVVMALMKLAVWLEYRNSPLENSGEEAMAGGIGFVISVIVGVILVGLVSLTGYVGARLTQQHSPKRPL